MKHWPYNPAHWFEETGTYIVTAGTYNKEHFFHSESRLEMLQKTLIELSMKYNWQLKAWAIFSNHYHFIASNNEDSNSFKKLITEYHKTTALKINERDNLVGRRVWYQYSDTYLSFRNSYMTRLNYVINNAVKHKIVEVASDYPYCSANWFKAYAPKSFQESISNFKIDKVNIYDEF
jgi:putative transposase